MDGYLRHEMPAMDPQIVDMDASSAFQDGAPAQAEVDDFLRKKRKAREHKACYPCRSRKVKCDLSRPCQTCRDRDHPELCSYHPPDKRQNIDQHSNHVLKTETDSGNSGMIMLGRTEFDTLCQKLNSLENSMADMRRELSKSSSERGFPPSTDTYSGQPRRDTAVSRGSVSHFDLHGIHTKNDAGEYVHFGAGSIPAMIYKLGQGLGATADEKRQMQERLGQSVLPLFGLDNESATYPFVDLWGLPHGSLQRAQELANALPGDAQLLQFFACYRDTALVMYPSMAEPKRFEEDLTVFLLKRSSRTGPEDGVTEQTMYGKNYQWLAVLFAALASGVQCSLLPLQERQLTSQVYICCSFECLRFTNFLGQPHLESIQALLIVGHVLTNNMNAGTAWSLLGLTIRLAQGLGLHRKCPPHVRNELVFPRSMVWWAVIWQDSLISVPYDRPSILNTGDDNMMPMPFNFTQVGAFHSVMYPLFKVGLDIIRGRSTAAKPRELHARINKLRDEITAIMRDAAEYLRDSRLCTSATQTLEHWGLYLHSSYMLSELYRPALSPSQDPEIVRAFRQLCIDNLADTVEAYVGLNNITSYARQAWGTVHRALSSALLLGILGEHIHNERVRRLMGRFISAIVNLTNNASGQEVTPPMQRGICALQKLNLPGARSPTTSFNFACPSDDGLSVNDDGGLKLTQNGGVVTPLSTEGSEREDHHSPYSVLNTILWGSADTRPEALVF